MNKRDPKLTVLLFNECINNHDRKKIAQYMADDYLFIDRSNNNYEGKESNVKGWGEFFDQFPDYKNIFPKLESRDNIVFIPGCSTCSYEPLDGPAIWVAKVENDPIAEWRIYDDTVKNRKKLGV